MNRWRWWCVLGCLVGAGSAMAQLSFPAPTGGVDGPQTDHLSPPVLLGGSNCSKTDWHLGLSGGIPGGRYYIYQGVSNPPNSVIQYLGDFAVSPNADGITYVDVSGVDPTWPYFYALQEAPNGVGSGYSLPLSLRDPKTLAKPTFTYFPLWECGRATYVDGHQPGDRLTLFSYNSTRFIVPSAFGQSDYMPAGSRAFSAGEMVSTQYSTCQGPPQTSPMSDKQIVAAYSGQLTRPFVESQSLIPGATRFVIAGVESGATLDVQVSRNGFSTRWSETCATPRCMAYLPSTLGLLQESDEVIATQSLCPGSESKPVKVVTGDCKAPAPTLRANPRIGDRQVFLSSWPRGGIIRVFAGHDVDPSVSPELIGYAYDTDTVTLSRPISASDLWVSVAVDTVLCRANLANAYRVRD